MKLFSFITFILTIVQVTVGLPFVSRRVLQLSEDTTITVPEYEKLSLLRKGVRFIDITEHVELPFFNKRPENKVVPTYKYPALVSNDQIVQKLIDNIDKHSMYDNLAKFTSFYTRYYKSEYGYQSAQWLEQKIQNITSGLPEKVLTVERFSHNWKQYSIIVKIEGSETPDDIIVMGSHQDSMNLILPSVLAAPGADDDGSGTVTNLEALRLYVEYFLKKGQRPKNTVEFHFYSAEEAGLLGSLDVFTHYSTENKRVVAMLQQDMTGYVQDPKYEHVGLVTDYTTEALTNFVKLIIDAYLSIPYIETECGYACSDHGSATKNGFPAAFVIESEFSKTSKYIHTTMDTLDRLSFDHMAEHTKIVIGSIIELGDWKFAELKN
ncbi:hypothetical protein Kpol_363p10 [Vanderwaltozyma polyspora DSM 70294]|uniref:Peptide hydrolase n=1 Tax=Vanderwaltozyma polyspora (strain ATCC 22028 / DSM 70294 / BCRC 21397 / CBS 2163 / NBRC 10782 / NRRL Y-8283 / UCD 57-17) TaxID=436907 RepID=A7TS93_VANPO|nr:uncharacterized protein Kpol_363p10 [Vanderwaltozyma polyspora DSM 70294]EDO14870.1 hypothetical protein Kpol_363p10 [Vanderwaltozyma polyspora DSM 70294]